MQPASTALRPLVQETLGAEAQVRFEFWDGSVLGPRTGVGPVKVRSPEAVRRIMWSPGELGAARAYVCGELDTDGDLSEVLRALRDTAPEGVRPRLLLAAGRALKDLSLPAGRPPPPPEEARPVGRLHSRSRDRKAVSHHYDVGNEFYSLVLGPTMTYSCARFAEPTMSLEEAQASKYELICRKLGLHERREMRLLDVGCGWGSMAIHAAREHGARVVGVTVSQSQADLGRKRVADAGVADAVEIRLQDYRDVADGPYDAISSIGMFEHVGAQRMGEYFSRLRSLLVPTGRLLNHAISSATGSKLGARGFMGRYVFPDGELLGVAEVVAGMEDAGFEVRDVESLREHYAATLRRWLSNLESGWERAVELVGERRARAWRLYMTGSSLGFEDGGIAVHQVLGVVPGTDGTSGMPPTRAGWP
ncbi:MAG TPA: cyclopropane-fatty-acyl-phospholipid synthase family protein [Acidimicrobiales bacterium]|nr:cyclopropane-fatty-acyl-phospholipid synthase family protein [Acidimicrobiales bacterium]